MAVTDLFWPWWAGAAGIAAVFLLVRLRERRWMGVSGSYGRIATPGEWAADRVRKKMKADARATEAAMMRATLEHFGPDALREMAPASAPEEESPSEPLSQGVHVTFLLSMIAGGLLSAWLSGTWQWSVDLGETFSRVIGEGAPALGILFAGGVSTGLGTRMAGGCTSGHGITGCARLLPASFAATATFFGVGVLTSYVLHWGAR